MVKRTNNDLQNTTQKTKDRTPLTIWGDRSCAGRVPVQLVAPIGRVTRVSLDVANLNPFVNYVTIDIWMGNDLLIRNLHTYIQDLHSGKTN